MANKWHVPCPGVMPLGNVIAGYLQKKDFKKRKENTLSTKKKARFKKNDKGQEKKKENSLSTQKIRFKKNDNDQEKWRKEMENTN